jgi:hypothetical protein
MAAGNMDAALNLRSRCAPPERNGDVLSAGKTDHD